ncbi:TIR domain-containing protein [Methylobacterium sp. HMF5984]|uniref:TIR domain-containing protein n=1 Tax=Methylobacterium sp. HMF5984 TaxID=3367370 RepID=UPI003853EB45
MGMRLKEECGQPPIEEAHAAGLGRALVDASSLDELRNIYFIGNFSGRINFFAQQTRALNLIWALLERGEIKPYDRVAVIGGGLAGVTAAVALLNKQVQVSLFEKQNNLFHFQRQTIIRHVHPTVNFWPEMDLIPSTSFPFLNWCENTPAKIIGSITAEIRDYFSDIPIHLRTTVKGIEKSVDGLTLRTGRTKTSGPFTAVLVACGFGLESPFKGSPHGIAHSYWENEGLLPFDLAGIKPAIFISGNGDGALIEVIRGSLNNFEEGREIIELAKILDRNAVKGDIVKLSKTESTRPSEYWASDEPYRAYLALPVPAAFQRRLKDNLTTGYTIFFNTRAPGKFSAASAIIHRIIVANLISLKRVNCVVGDLKTVDWSTRPVKVTAKHKDENEWKGSASRVLIRHGAARSLDWILDKQQQGRLAERQKQQFANSLTRHWGSEYYNDAERFPPFDSPEYINRYLPRVREYLSGKCDVQSVAVGQKSGKHAYQVYCESAKAVAALPKQVFGVAVFGQVKLADVTAYARTVDMSAVGHDMSLRPGVSVTIVDKEISKGEGSGNLYCTLPCFVTAKGVSTGIIAPLHSSGFFKSQGETDINRLIMLSAQDRLIATLVQGSNISRRVGDGAHTPEFGLFKLKKGVNFKTTPNAAPKWIRAAAREEFFDLLGTEVIKIGATSGLTKGRLDVVELDNLSIRYSHGEMVTFNGLFGVKGYGDEPFSLPGDSGSIIMTPDGLLLGLVVAGAPRSNLTFGVVLSQLLGEFSCQLLVKRGDRQSPNQKTEGTSLDGFRDQIFISAASKDRLWSSRLEQRLRPLTYANQINIFRAHHMSAGTDWKASIQQHLERTRIAIMMISPDYLTSDSTRREMEVIAERAKRGDCQVLAVMLKPTELYKQFVPMFQFVIPPERPLSSMAPAELDDALSRIARNVAQASAP